MVQNQYFVITKWQKANEEQSSLASFLICCSELSFSNHFLAFGDDDALGSIEYAVDHLHSPLLVIMGHEGCGAVTAAYDSVKNGVPTEGKIASIVEKIAPVISDSNNVAEAIHKNINAVYDEVLKDEIIKKSVNEGKLSIVKAYYDLDGTVIFE